MQSASSPQALIPPPPTLRTDPPRPALGSLVTASQTYFKASSRRDKLEDAELAASNGKEKVLPVEALGLVMIHYGDSLGRGSQYGQCALQGYSALDCSTKQHLI